MTSSGVSSDSRRSRMLSSDLRRALEAVAAAILLLLGACGSHADDRQEEVADRGAEVMPFDLDKTTHRFTKTDRGGIQAVRADDPADVEQVDLIRGHLSKEAARFRSGDFSDPTRIHGEDMPGVAELSALYRAVTVGYQERPDGAELSFASDDPAAVSAIHRWFDAQTTDHSGHAG